MRTGYGRWLTPEYWDPIWATTSLPGTQRICSIIYTRRVEKDRASIPFCLLEDRLDLRIRVEATLSHFFGRDVALEWHSGNLVPKAVRQKTGESYRLDRDECHGIKELLVLLTHLYDEEHEYLIIDEPELNLHPQYQAFFMQEVRKVTGKKSASGNTKIVFLITHSPFILDLRSDVDVRSVISFDLEYSVPRQVACVSPDVTSALVESGRLNAYHKQLFFSDNPVFVEGHHDALLVEALMEARGVSAAAAGSCVIDSGCDSRMAGIFGDLSIYKFCAHSTIKPPLCVSLGSGCHFLRAFACGDRVWQSRRRRSART